MGVLAHVVPKTPPRKMCQKPHPEKNRKKPVLTGKSQQPPPENSQGQMGNHKKPEKTGFNWKNRKNGK